MYGRKVFFNKTLLNSYVKLCVHFILFIGMINDSIKFKYFIIIYLEIFTRYR